MRRPTPILVATLVAVALTAGSAAAQGAATTNTAAKLKWGPAPPGLPAGAKAAVVEGDPGKTGPFTVRLMMPNGYRIAPHSHPTDELVTVKRGALRYGMGDKWESAKMHTLVRGKSATMKAGEDHYVRANGNTVVEVQSTGPFEINYVNPADDPRHKKGAKPKA